MRSRRRIVMERVMLNTVAHACVTWRVSDADLAIAIGGCREKSSAAEPTLTPVKVKTVEMNPAGKGVRYSANVATFVTLLLVPVIYAIFVLDLKLVKWEAVGGHTDGIRKFKETTGQFCLSLKKGSGGADDRHG